MKHAYARILAELRGSSRHYWQIGVFILFAAIADALLPLPFKFLIDDILGYGEASGPALPFESFFRTATDPLHLALGFIVLYLGIMAASMLFEYAYSVLLRTRTRELVHGFSSRAFRAIETMPLEEYRSRDIGDYLYRVSNETEALGDVVENVFLQGVQSAIYICAALTVMLYLNPALALLTIAAVPLFILIITQFGRRLTGARRRAERTTSLLFSFLEETFGQLKNIQAYRQEAREAAAFERTQGIALSNDFRVEQIDFLFRLLLGLAVVLVYASVIAVGIVQVEAGLTSAGVLVLFMFYLDNLTQPLLSFLGMFASVKERVAVLDRVFTLMPRSSGGAAQADPIDCAQGDIRFRAVTVVAGEGVQILKRASFTVPKRSITVLVGPNGSGKSTILGLLMGFLRPASGSISIGTVDIASLTTDHVRRIMAYMPQEVVLFDDTIAANIAFGAPDIARARIAAAARKAVADGFIRRLEGGYDFRVGDEGLRLSGGQRQRILLARAFAQEQAQYLLLDEPFSSLDLESMARVIQSLRAAAKTQTLLIVSNALEILDHADHVIALDDGRVRWEGPARGFLKQEVAKKIFSLA